MEKIFERIQKLEEAIIEEGESGINRRSLGRFYIFMAFCELIKTEKYKLDISSTPDNEIYMSVRFKNKFAFHFCDDGNIVMVNI